MYLFDSRSRGDAGQDSDWDLMVIVPESQESSLHRAQRAYRALTGVHLPMDILVWTRKEFDWQATVFASLPAVILREGRLLYAAWRRKDPARS
ncbi:MAG: nucleotidyltransferase domain-containing protein [Dehalococcoidia bacterium]